MSRALFHMIVFEPPACWGACLLNGERLLAFVRAKIHVLAKPCQRKEYQRILCFTFLVALWLSVVPLCATDILSVLPRFLASLTAAPSPSNQASPARDCCRELAVPGQDSCHNREPPSRHYHVRFNLEGLLDFQGMHSAATQGEDGHGLPSVNFRKRPNYDNTKRSLMKIQRGRQQCPT